MGELQKRDDCETMLDKPNESPECPHGDEARLSDSGGPWDDKKQRRPWGSSSYADLIVKAIQSSPEKRLRLSEIYDWIVKNVPYFAEKNDDTSSTGWKNSIRHNLSLHECFIRESVKDFAGSYWKINPNCPRGRKRYQRAHSSSPPTNHQHAHRKHYQRQKAFSLDEATLKAQLDKAAALSSFIPAQSNYRLPLPCPIAYGSPYAATTDNWLTATDHLAENMMHNYPVFGALGGVTPIVNDEEAVRARLHTLNNAVQKFYNPLLVNGMLPYQKHAPSDMALISNYWTNQLLQASSLTAAQSLKKHVDAESAAALSKQQRHSASAHDKTDQSALTADNNAAGDIHFIGQFPALKLPTVCPYCGASKDSKEHGMHVCRKSVITFAQRA